ncbi:helix-turn-helix domain-containing protein [Microbacterium sp. zg.Y909]|uniref:helix-turn-helix domain-containing protein n=1 Tax=Microbacterium sp. zg.Y909 TaxID=2969413 RepID=UPI00214C552D|nr:helix-turn-helix transcriptional regulator [Microbacterium sp. zg.Y909]MCR2825194.1 helix-turn-helix domain-containing protein [Microbacterium sp. zg.Y909]
MTDDDRRVARAIGDTLKCAKDKAGLTFDDLAGMSGMSRPHVTRILYGTIDVRVGDLRRLCAPLELDVYEVWRAAEESSR